jgi:outer membrane protein assembly factor BamA
LLGHSSTNTTLDVYGHVSREDLAEASAERAGKLLRDVGLKRDLPKLKIRKAANSYVYVNVLAVEAGPNGVAVCVRIEVNRPVKILRDGSNSEVTETDATVWSKERLLVGPKCDMASRVREAISDLTTYLAAAYYRDNTE